MQTLVQRDVRDLANIDGLTDMPRLLALLAARSGALINMSEVSRAAGIAHSTLRRYLALLQATFMFQPLPAWSCDSGRRLVKSPKIHLLDSGREGLCTGPGGGQADPLVARPVDLDDVQPAILGQLSLDARDWIWLWCRWHVRGETRQPQLSRKRLSPLS